MITYNEKYQQNKITNADKALLNDSTGVSSPIKKFEFQVSQLRIMVGK